jgi:3-oxoacyl-[acyl-carrier-protein] synthase-1
MSAVDARTVWITGTGAICAAGRTADDMLAALVAGRSALAPIRSWDATNWPTRVAAECADLDLRTLVKDRKLLKLIRRTDVFGLNAGSQALDASGVAPYRDALEPAVAAKVSDRIGVYVGSGGNMCENQYDYLPLISEAKNDLVAFGRELSSVVNPMWLLRTLPNNVLCHVGINYGLKGTNACITNHSVSGMLAVIEAVAGLRAGEADRAVAIGHDAPIEPQNVLYYNRMGLVSRDQLRPFDAARDGSLFGEGAGAFVLETPAAAAERGATPVGEVLGGGYASEGLGLAAVSPDGDGVERAIRAALDDAGIATADVGMIVAHANGTRASDASEAVAILRVFGGRVPPVTGCKWSFGHLLAAAGAAESVVALHALRAGVVPGIANLETLDPAFAGLPAMRENRQPASKVALVLSRGFGGTNAALMIRAA